jgi:hypothetical protein
MSQKNKTNDEERKGSRKGRKEKEKWRKGRKEKEK